MIDNYIDSKNFYFPKIVNDKIIFYQVNSSNQFKLSNWSILEPDSNKKWKNNCLNKTLIIVPCVCIDKNGIRIGRGKGFYDRFLANINKNKIHTLSIIPEFAYIKNDIPNEIWDIEIDSVIVLNESTKKTQKIK